VRHNFHWQDQSYFLSYDTFRCCATQFSLISVGLCKYPIKDH
jgi:hypothetical protein